MRLMGVTFMKEECGILSDQMCTDGAFAHPFLPSSLVPDYAVARGSLLVMEMDHNEKMRGNQLCCGAQS